MTEGFHPGPAQKVLPSSQVSFPKVREYHRDLSAVVFREISSGPCGSFQGPHLSWPPQEQAAHGDACGGQLAKLHLA